MGAMRAYDIGEWGNWVICNTRESGFGNRDSGNEPPAISKGLSPSPENPSPEPRAPRPESFTHVQKHQNARKFRASCDRRRNQGVGAPVCPEIERDCSPL